MSGGPLAGLKARTGSPCIPVSPIDHLADAEGLTGSDYLRLFIRREHAKHAKAVTAVKGKKAKR